MAFNTMETVSAKEGSVYATIDGRNIHFFDVKSIEASISHESADIPMLGARMKQRRIVGAEGSGSMVVYYVNPEFRKYAVNYIKTGEIPDISLRIVNDDKASLVGRQSMLIKGVMFNGAPLAKLDATSGDVLDQSIDFTFNDADILQEFN